MTSLILQRLNLFTTWAVTTVIILVVALVIVRMIVEAANLNFFGWTYRTIRRLTDPLLVPVRGALRGFGVDPKYAPLVTILIAILLGYFVVRLTDTIILTIGGVLDAVQQHAPGRLIGHFLYGLLSIYALLIFMRIIFSWVMISYQNRVMRFLLRTTEPLLGPLRRMIPPLGMFDISAIVAFLIIWLFQGAIAGTLLR
jgi:YggT family protein